MTLYQRILEAMKEKPMRYPEIADRVDARPSSLKSAVRDLHKCGYLSSFGKNRAFTYTLTDKAKSFTKLKNVEIARKQQAAPVTTVQYAKTRVANSVFNLAQF